MDTYSEEHRHACEVSTLLGWGADKRRTFLEMVAKKRGQEVANRLRSDVYKAWIVKKAAEIGPLDAEERERRLWKIERGAGLLKRKDVEAALAANDNQADLFGATERQA